VSPIRTPSPPEAGTTVVTTVPHAHTAGHRTAVADPMVSAPADVSTSAPAAPPGTKGGVLHEGPVFDDDDGVTDPDPVWVDLSRLPLPLPGL
jgi:hypothetical protein